MTAEKSSENLNRRPAEVQLPDRFYKECLQVLGGAGADAAMVLDDQGSVIFCSQGWAEALESTPEALTGRPLAEFVPGLPLRKNTSGNNVAYATFYGKQNAWREHCAVDTCGKRFWIELLMDVVVVNLRYLILVWARYPKNRERMAPENGTVRKSSVTRQEFGVAHHHMA